MEQCDPIQHVDGCEGECMEELWCDACGFRGVELKEYTRPATTDTRTVASLCSLCAGTVSGNAYHYPGQYRETQDILFTICYVGNQILKAIKENK